MHLFLSAEFTRASALHGALGGLLLGLAASMHLLLRGRITGISGICSGISSTSLTFEKRSWRLAFLSGMAVAASIFAELAPGMFTSDPLDPSIVLALSAGFLVGAGTKFGSGCTSGHGVCGLPRFSRRSFVAVCTFMGTGVVVASIVDTLGLRRAWSAPSEPSPLLRRAIVAVSVLSLLLVLLRALRAEKRFAPTNVDQYAPRASIEVILSALLGALFSIGLSVSGMSKPSRVLGFLSPLGVTGWDPTLICVLCSALLLNLVTFALILRRKRPVLACAFELPAQSEITRSLVGGSALFGVGWGLAGVCPGPAVVILASGKPVAIPLAAAFLFGQAVADALEKRREVPPLHTVGKLSPMVESEASFGSEGMARMEDGESCGRGKAGLLDRQSSVTVK